MASARSRSAGDGRRRAAVKRRIGQLTMTEVKRPSVAWRASAAVELGTGTTLIAVPGVVMDALIGSSPSAAELVARVLGGALLSLGIAGALEDEHSPDTGVTLGSSCTTRRRRRSSPQRAPQAAPTGLCSGQ